MQDHAMTHPDAEDNVAPESAPIAPPCAMVIFGAAGDLTKRLVVPALYDLVTAKRLADEFRLIGVDLAAKTSEDWRQDLTEMMNEFVTKDGGEFEADHIDEEAWRWLTSRMSYLQGDLTDPDCYRRLDARSDAHQGSGAARECLSDSDRRHSGGRGAALRANIARGLRRCNA
jgi:glucose-6-phosphate 1-dehydrogenase